MFKQSGLSSLLSWNYQGGAERLGLGGTYKDYVKKRNQALSQARPRALMSRYRDYRNTSQPTKSLQTKKKKRTEKSKSKRRDRDKEAAYLAGIPTL